MQSVLSAHVQPQCCLGRKHIQAHKRCRESSRSEFICRAQSTNPHKCTSESSSSTPTQSLGSQQQDRRHILTAAGLQLALWPVCQLQARAEGEAVVAEGPTSTPPADSSSPSVPVSGKVKQVRMRTLSDSALSVSVYPEFEYNASGGGGMAEASSAGSGNRYNVKFDVEHLNIPDVSAKTAKWLGVPMLPGAKIKVLPTKLEGFIDRDTGEVQMQFIAEFNFSAGGLYKAPPLYVTTNLTTEEVQGSIRHGQGKRLNDKGVARLVGVATVPTTTDTFINKFLMLPTETFAVMSSEFAFL